MIDSIIAGTGNSRYLRSSIPAGTTWDDVLTMLRAGTFPIDLAGINAAGFTTLGTALNAENLLASATITALGLSSDATPDDALNALITAANEKLAANQGVANSGKIMGVNSDGSVKYVPIDSAPTEDSTNLISSGAVYEALSDIDIPVQSVAGKTGDVTLDADDVAYDPNETYSTGTVGKGLNDANENILKAFPTDTASGAVASFPDGAAMPVKSLVVGIEPWQNLHGFDYPWPSGGLGINLLENKLANGTPVPNTSGGVVSVYENGVIHLPATGNNPSDREFVINDNAGIGPGSYIISRPVSNYEIADDKKRIVVTVDGVEVKVSSSDVTVTAVTGITKVAIFIPAGYSCVIDVAPMIRPSTVTSNTYIPFKNVGAIYGWTGANIYKANNNLILAVESAVLAGIATNYVYQYNATAGTSLVFPVAKGATYYFNRPTGCNRNIWGFFKERPTAGTGKQTEYATQSNNGPVTAPFSGWCVVFCKSTYDADIAAACQISTFAPTEVVTPNTTSVAVSFPAGAGTVYGGTLDVLTGVLTVDRTAITFDGSETWSKYTGSENYNPNGTCFRINVSGLVGWSSGAKDYLVCNCFKVCSLTTPNQKDAEANSFWVNNAGDGLRFVWGEPNDGSAVEDFTTWLASNNVTVVAKLATPQTYQLSATEVTTLLGENNVWADTGNVTVEYRSNPALYVDKKIAASEQVMELIITANRESAMKASKAYSSGDLIIVSGKLYKATTSIANGATLTVGTNVSLTTVAAEIAAVSS